MSFEGFRSSKEKLTPIPETFFSKVLSEIENLGELKLILYAFWFLNQHQGDMQYLTLTELTNDEALMKSFQPDGARLLEEALEQAVQHRVLLKAEYRGNALFFLNSPRGRAASQALGGGEWALVDGVRPAFELQIERPNIFRLYEENIGPLTPLLSDILQDAEDIYPAGWIEDAIRIAVEKNVRNWRYVDAILKSWQKEGRYEKDRRNSQEDRRKYIEGDYGDIIEH